MIAPQEDDIADGEPVQPVVDPVRTALAARRVAMLSAACEMVVRV